MTKLETETTSEAEDVSSSEAVHVLATEDAPNPMGMIEVPKSTECNKEEKQLENDRFLMKIAADAGVIPLATSQNEQRAAQAAARPATSKPGATRATGEEGSGMRRLRGLAKNREQALNAAPSSGSTQNTTSQQASGNKGSDLVDAEQSAESSKNQVGAPHKTDEKGSDLMDAKKPAESSKKQVGAPHRTDEEASPTTPLALPSPDIDLEMSRDPTAPFPPASDDADLAVAQPVEDYTISLMEAEEVDVEELQKRNQKWRECKLIGFVIVFICCIALALTLGFTLGKKNEKSPPLPPTVAPSLAPSGAPSSAPTGALDLLLQDLPAYTLESLENGAGSSPQWLALQWLEDHPQLEGMPMWRKKQLLALATFFNAMEGPNWPKPIQDSWIKYTDECHWFTTTFGEFDSATGKWVENNYYDLTNQTNCNEEDEFVYLDLVSLGLSGYKAFIPPEIALLSSLSVLSLPRNDINAPIAEIVPTQFYQMANLTILDLNENSLSGPIPNEFGMITSLVELLLDGNALTGPIPTELGLLTSMTNLWLDDNSLTGTIPSELGRMANMVDLSLDVNALTGPIPSELGFLTFLTGLYLKESSLTGPIPSELGFLTFLTGLYLNENSLTGPIPNDFGMMTSLVEFGLDENALTGPIPTELGLLTNMTELHLRGNSLDGPIPSELGLLVDLRSLQLENNALSGVIPEWLDDLVSNGSLQTLTLANNSFSGTVPESLCSMGLFDPELHLGLSFDCGVQLCGCCWCPCPDSNVNSTECQTHPVPGLFPNTNGNGSIVIAIHIRTDDYPEEVTLEWSLYGGPGYWELLNTHSPEDASSVHSYAELVKSESLYRLKLLDSYGDGVDGNGWFIISDSTPSRDHAEGSVIWHATGDSLESFLEVYLWIDAEGRAQQVEHLSGEGYALIQDESETGGEPIIVVFEAVTNSTNGA